MLFYGWGVLAGILIAIVVVGGMALALPHVTAHRGTEPELVDDPAERFAHSARILTRDVTDYRDDDIESVSTPLTRRAQLNELRLIARQAARRRMVVLLTLLGTALLLLVLSLAGVTPAWSALVPTSLIAAFLGVARFSVVAMHRSLDARARAVRGGFDEDEDTAVIELADDEASEAIEISVDLSMPATMGALWDPIPVTPPTYVSQPLLPRTVRTIDLSAPVVTPGPVPTADGPTGAGVAPTPRRAVGE